MPTMILKLLTLIALALMPFGMGAAMAGPAHHPASTASAGHCDEQGGQPAGDRSSIAPDCTACSMAIVAQARVHVPAAAARVPAARPFPVRGIGLHPETATPPPKSS